MSINYISRVVIKPVISMEPVLKKSTTQENWEIFSKKKISKSKYVIDNHKILYIPRKT